MSARASNTSDMQAFTKEVSDFLSLTRMAEATFGVQSCGDGSFVRDLRAGMVPRPTRVARVRAFIADVAPRRRASSWTCPETMPARPEPKRRGPPLSYGEAIGRNDEAMANSVTRAASEALLNAMLRYGLRHGHLLSLSPAQIKIRAKARNITA